MITQGIVKKILGFYIGAVRYVTWCHTGHVWSRLSTVSRSELKSLLGSLPKPTLEQIYAELITTEGYLA